MRSETEIFDLILSTAREDDRIRAVVLNGSRANPNAPRDPFQDYDIVYIVTDTQPFTRNLEWIRRFGEMMILQLPDDMESAPEGREGYCYLMQFADGNRIDLTVHTLAAFQRGPLDSQTVVLLDKDSVLGAVPPASDRDYLPKPPTAKAFDDCCNEFWWVSPYAAKGLWRGEITYAKKMLDDYIREQLMKMLRWHIGLRTDFTVSPGKEGKYMQRYLTPDEWQAVLRTYSDADYDHTWDALFAMGGLFRQIAVPLAEHYGFPYPFDDDRRVSAYLSHIRELPRDAKEIYP